MINDFWYCFDRALNYSQLVKNNVVLFDTFVVVLNLMWKMRYFQPLWFAVLLSWLLPWKESLQMGLEALEMFKEVQHPNIHCTRYFAAWKVGRGHSDFSLPDSFPVVHTCWHLDDVSRTMVAHRILVDHKPQQSSFASWATRSYKYQLCGGPQSTDATKRRLKAVQRWWGF